MFDDIHSIDRRTTLKGVGALGAAAVGGFAFTGNAVASDTTLEASDPSAVTTDDGEIKYVAYGGRLRFEWDGLDSSATYGRYEAESRVDTGSGYSSWRSHGSANGELGANWGGDNDYTEETGTDGMFQFKFGSPYGQKSYAIAGSGSAVQDAGNKYETDVFEAESDGGTQETTVQLRKTCQVWNGEPGNGGTKLIGASDTATFTVTVSNREATATTGGEIEGEVGADES
jgi:outer membrane lipoprotein SlyB